MAEYRLEELARRADTTVRNIRAYRDRGLLPSPRRAGRVALYDDAHLGRLRLITDLLDRGYTLANIAELIAAWEHGRDIADVLGLEAVLAQQWSHEPSATTTRAEIEVLLGRPVPDSMVRDAIAVGLLEVVAEGGADGPACGQRVGPSEVTGAPDQELRVRSPSQLAAGNALVDAGVPLEDVLALGLRVHEQIDDIARSFVDLISTHLFDPLGELPAADELAALSRSVERLRPAAHAVVDAELARAIERHVRQHLGSGIDRAPLGATADAR